MASLRELDSLKKIVEQQQEDIKELRATIAEINLFIKKEEKKTEKEEKKTEKEEKKTEEIAINKSLNIESENNDLSIIFTRYKQSILVKNIYLNKNRTVKCKNQFIELGAKWFKNGESWGWLFVGAFKDNSKSLEEVSKFIIDKLNEYNFNLEIKYE